MKFEKRINITTPIGEVPSQCPELERRIAALPEDSSISDILKVIDEWELWAIRKFRRMEQTTRSGWIGPDPYHRALEGSG